MLYTAVEILIAVLAVFGAYTIWRGMVRRWKQKEHQDEKRRESGRNAADRAGRHD